ncbi:hypothetical protein ACOMHN_013227 [Nucella lapillus]
MCTFYSSPAGGSGRGQCRLHSQVPRKNSSTAADVQMTDMSGAKSVARRPRCDGAGYVLTCDRCVKAVKGQVNYTIATQGCRDPQGQLVRAKSAEEISCFQAFASDTGLTEFWVGANYTKTQGEFRWNDGTLLPVNSTLWAVDEPNEYTYPDQPDCVRIITNGSGLLDRWCWRNFQYMCQKDAILM